MADAQRSDNDYFGLEWCITLPTEGRSAPVQTLNWNLELGNGELLSDAKHSQLLFELQSFLRIAITEAITGRPMGLGSAWSIFSGLMELARFMCSHRLASVKEVTSQVSWDFVEYVRDHYEDCGVGGGNRPRELTFASAYRILRPLSKLHEMHMELRQAGVATLPEPPYSGMTTFAVVSSHLKLDQAEMHQPIPDEVSIPTLSRAALWVMEGSQDVIRLQAIVLGLMSGQENVSAKRRAKEQAAVAISQFQFTTRQETGLPWHSSIVRQERKTLRGGSRTLTLIEEFRRLMSQLVAACIITIQGSTGMRAHELIGLRVNVDEPGSLPCLDRTVSSDGLMEIFTLKGITAKRHTTEHSWTTGLRPYGSDALPVAVRAVYVLEELLRPWRELLGDDHLLLVPGTGLGLPLGPRSMVPFRSSELTLVQREFAADALVESGYSWDEAVDLCGEVRGARWRTTFAQAVFRTSPRLLGALSDHYRHVNDLITDQGYIGNDAALLEDLEGERVQATARTLLEIAIGMEVGAGAAQRLVAKHRAQLEDDIDRMPGKTPIDRAEAFVKLHDVRIWTGQYASCLINLYPSLSRCNPDAETSPGFAMPNKANRSPATCASCNCGVIMPDHRKFWESRHAESKRIMDAENTSEFAARHSIARRRAAQSQAILRALMRRKSATNQGDAGVAAT